MREAAGPGPLSAAEAAVPNRSRRFFRQPMGVKLNSQAPHRLAGGIYYARFLDGCFHQFQIHEDAVRPR